MIRFSFHLHEFLPLDFHYFSNFEKVELSMLLSDCRAVTITI